MNTEEIKRIEDTYTANTYTRYDVALTEGRGSRVKGPEGQEYVDFTAGLGVNSLGFCDPGWVAAVQEQVGKMQHTSNLFYTEPCSKVAEKLFALTGMPRVFFSNSGAEANEGAIKAARKYSFMKYGQGESDGFERYRIATLTGSFHGRTIATLTATGQDVFHKNFSPFLEGFDYVNPVDIEALHKTVNDKTCAIMIECIQGEGGVIDIDRSFIEEVAKLCIERDILLIVDEVQTGIGRTGKFMAYEHFGVKPDIVTVAKGLGGGLPIGCLILGEKVEDVFGPGDHGTTFGGNPVICAGVDYILSKFMDGGAFLNEIAGKGDYLREKLLGIPGIKSVSGIGFMFGIDVGEKDVKAVCKEAYKRGLLVLTAKTRLRLLPPLNIEQADIDEGLAILAESIAAV